jgi:hypothetical protein
MTVENPFAGLECNCMLCRFADLPGGRPGPSSDLQLGVQDNGVRESEASAVTTYLHRIRAVSVRSSALAVPGICSWGWAAVMIW